jgi:hypothetical protein
VQQQATTDIAPSAPASPRERKLEAGTSRGRSNVGTPTQHHQQQQQQHARGSAGPEQPQEARIHQPQLLQHLFSSSGRAVPTDTWPLHSMGKDHMAETNQPAGTLPYSSLRCAWVLTYRLYTTIHAQNLAPQQAAGAHYSRHDVVPSAVRLVVRGVELVIVIAVRAPRNHTIHRVVLCPLTCGVSPRTAALARVNIIIIVHSSQSRQAVAVRRLWDLAKDTANPEAASPSNASYPTLITPCSQLVSPSLTSTEHRACSRIRR